MGDLEYRDTETKSIVAVRGKGVKAGKSKRLIGEARILRRWEVRQTGYATNQRNPEGQRERDGGENVDGLVERVEPLCSASKACRQAIG